MLYNEQDYKEINENIDWKKWLFTPGEVIVKSDLSNN